MRGDYLKHFYSAIAIANEKECEKETNIHKQK